MHSFAYREPGKIPAGILAVLVHVLFFGLLVFGFSWKTRPPEGMVVDLWSSLPPPPAQPAPVPAAQPEVKPAPPPNVKAEEPPKRKPVAKPDIELKEKAERERRRQEEAKKLEAEKRRLEEQKAREQALKEQQAREQALKEQKAREAEALRLKQEQEALNRQLLAQQAAAQSRLVDEYKSRIMSKIKRYIVMPPDIPGNPQAEFDVRLLPSGDVLDVKLKKSSNHAAYDSAVERAIYKAQPLPLPPDPALFAQFRNLELKFRPHE